MNSFRRLPIIIGTITAFTASLTAIPSCSESSPVNNLGAGGWGGDSGVSAVMLDPSVQSFPNAVVGRDSGNQVFTLRNISTIAVWNLVPRIEGADANDFQVVTSDCPSILDPGKSCNIAVRFAPLSAGSKTANLVLRANPGSSSSSQLRGIADPASGLTVTPTFQDLGQLTLNLLGVPYEFEVNNGGDFQTGNVTSEIGGKDAAQFAMVTNTCGAPLPPNGKCKIAVRFHPSQEGPKSATLTIHAGSSGGALANLSATAIRAPELQLSPVKNDFGSIQLGQQSSNIFVVENKTTTTSGVIVATVVGANPAEFPILDNGCKDKLEGLTSCSIVLAFHPTTLGKKAASLRIAATPGGQLSAELNGAGASENDFLVTKPVKQDFGRVSVGMESPQLVTLENTGNVASGVPALSLVGGNFSEFRIANDDCKSGILPGARCTVTIHFTPKSQGEKSAQLSVSATPGGHVGTDLTGTGLEPLSIDDAEHDFGSVRINATNRPSQVFTIRNRGQQATGPLRTSISTGNTDEFRFAGDTCKDLALEPNASCFVTVQFSPRNAGMKLGTLVVSGTPGGNVTATLKGTGVTSDSVVIDPDQHDFGDQRVNTAGPQYTFTVRNDTFQRTGSLQVSLSPRTPQDFTLASDNCASARLDPGATCRIIAQFTPKSAGQHAATLTVTASGRGATSFWRGNGTP